MIVHSKDFVTNLDEACIQPNAVDLRLRSISVIGDQSCITISETTKEFISRIQLKPKDGWFVLRANTTYDVLSRNDVHIPAGMCGWLIIRSTLARNGVILSGGLYDSNFRGQIGCVLHNTMNTDIQVESNLRFAQFIMAKAETDHLYQGFYNKPNSNPHTV